MFCFGFFSHLNWLLMYELTMGAVVTFACVIEHSALELILLEDARLLRWGKGLNFGLIS